MKNLWSDEEAKSCGDDPLALRVYTSRLLGREPALVLHGGGNTSVKCSITDLFGDQVEVLYVKGSGWDLATIKAEGFAPVRLDTLRRMATLESLADSQMVDNQRTAMLNPNAPNPSVEAILHALIPFKFVDHTHTDSAVTLSNNPQGEKLIRQVLGERVLIVPYVMPGFDLAKAVYALSRDLDWSTVDGIMLMNHGLFTFADDAKTSYTRMIDLVTRTEEYFKANSAWNASRKTRPGVNFNLTALAQLRSALSKKMGTPVIVQTKRTESACGFASRDDAADIGTRGPLTPDHVIRTKRIPLVVDPQDVNACVEHYVAEYLEYYKRNKTASQQCLDPVPRWAIWPDQGTLAIGRNLKEASVIADITEQTIQAIQRAEMIGGWDTLGEKDIFDVEYWELEQAKLKKSGQAPVFQGKVALITGGASGIGRACAESLYDQGACVVVTDLSPEVETLFNKPGAIGITGDVTDTEHLLRAVEGAVESFGGLDIVISNAGIFPPSREIEAMLPAIWDQSISVNLTAQQQLMQTSIPFLKHGIDPSIIIIASKNVPAPGPGQAAYSVAKAGLTQLVRVAALELGQHGIRVNALHPNAVFDTGAWTDEQLSSRADHYGMSVEEYKANNVLGTEVTSMNVAELVCSVAGPAFAKSTGVQIPIDGGNDRVI